MRIAVLDIGGTSIKSGIWDGETLSELMERDTNAWEGGARLMERAAEILEEYAPFDAIGISTAGQVDTERGTIYYANGGHFRQRFVLLDLPLLLNLIRQELRERFVPLCVQPAAAAGHAARRAPPRAEQRPPPPAAIAPLPEGARQGRRRQEGAGREGRERAARGQCGAQRGGGA